VEIIYGERDAEEHQRENEAKRNFIEYEKP